MDNMTTNKEPALKRVIGWILTGLLLIEGWLAYYAVMLGVLLVLNRPKGFGYYIPADEAFLSVPSGIVLLALAVYIPFVTCWGGQKLTGVPRGKYAVFSVCLLLVGAAAALIISP